MADEELDDKELDTAKLLWEEYKHQNALFWQMVFASTAVVVTLLTIPFWAVQSDVGKDLVGKARLLFPIAAIAFAAMAWFVLGGFSERFRGVGVLYRDIVRKRLGAERVKIYRIDHPIFKTAIAPVITWVFPLLSILFAIVEIVMLWRP